MKTIAKQFAVAILIFFGVVVVVSCIKSASGNNTQKGKEADNNHSNLNRVAHREISAVSILQQVDYCRALNFEELFDGSVIMYC